MCGTAAEKLRNALGLPVQQVTAPAPPPGLTRTRGDGEPTLAHSRRADSGVGTPGWPLKVTALCPSTSSVGPDCTRARAATKAPPARSAGPWHPAWHCGYNANGGFISGSTSTVPLRQVRACRGPLWREASAGERVRVALGAPRISFRDWIEVEPLPAGGGDGDGPVNFRGTKISETDALRQSAQSEPPQPPFADREPFDLRAPASRQRPELAGLWTEEIWRAGQSAQRESMRPAAPSEPPSRGGQRARGAWLPTCERRAHTG
ncbi:hypothetical protein L227DRAFT_115599 [Lentinus tigrinus ALCF2SS1-6]|uniref:Uncharacterized protein n=1 Tax=Lentinus tigrinus ALCF2SS1-6 TaxID=1328759 RepID=A0A5C2S7V6_9APHY|nr:hypothetical protein L227DRAFT_115599 [Lentinus tigrinus ALCF2SS1-6]